MMVLAVTLHNIPEGMAVGVMYAGFLAGSEQITAASALVLSLGIAIQNIPEGAIISMPLRAEGQSRGKAFAGGVLSGIVEPIGAVQVRRAYTFTMSESGRLSCSKNATAYHGRYFTPPCLETLAPHRTMASSSPHSPTAMRLSSALCRM